MSGCRGRNSLGPSVRGPSVLTVQISVDGEEGILWDPW